jgi:hypothetical protein
MNEKSLSIVQQLIDKTEKGLVFWSSAFLDGQFKTILGDGQWAFVVQVKGNIRSFLLLDDHQETILEEEIREDASLQCALDTLRSERGLRAMYPTSPHDKFSQEAEKALLFEEIGRLQELARSKALKVNEKVVQAEEFLASLS